MRVPFPLRPFRGMAKSSIRAALRMRVRHLPITLAQAEWWAERIKAWPAVFGEGPYSREVVLDPGFRLNGRITDVVERALVTEGVWDPAVSAFLRRNLRSGDCFVDVGAHAGYFSLLASRLVGGSGRVIAVEPSPVMIERFVNHFRINGCTNVTLLSLALGEEAGWHTLGCSSASNPGGATLLPRASGLWAYPVRVMPFDDIVVGDGPRPRVVKIDVEGYESSVLRGMRRTLREATPVVVCEVSPRFLLEQGLSASGLVDFMQGLGYRAHCLGDDGSPGPPLVPDSPGLTGNDQLEVVFLPPVAGT